MLCAVHGTALLNALFLHAKAVIIHLMPYGTIGRMGTNTKNAALIWKERTLLILSSEDPKSSSRAKKKHKRKKQQKPVPRYQFLYLK